MPYEGSGVGGVSGPRESDVLHQEFQELIAAAADIVRRSALLQERVRASAFQRGGEQTLLLTAEQTAQTLMISRSQVFALLRTGELRSLKLGASRRIPRDAICEYIAVLESRRYDEPDFHV